MPRPVATDKWVSILWPVLAAAIVNGLIFGTGINNSDSAFDQVWFAPPGWLVGCVWMVLFAMLGYARWRVENDSPTAHPQSRWITGFIIWGLAYPLTSAGFDSAYGQLVNTVSLLFALFVYCRIRRVAPVAALWLLPLLIWLGFATFWGIVALSA